MCAAVSFGSATPIYWASVCNLLEEVTTELWPRLPTDGGTSDVTVDIKPFQVLTVKLCVGPERK